MIVDRLDACDVYAPLHPLIAPALAFLRRPDLADLPDGRCEIDGQRLYAIIARTSNRGREKSPLEAHRRYVDLQYVVSGADLIGWRPAEGCLGDGREYDAERDIEFFADQPDAWYAVGPGQLAILLPSDAHAPLAGAGPVHKVVVKLLWA